MPSERALLIKQRQQEALRRQQNEIAERDAIRKQKEHGIKASQPIQPITTPQSIHDLFNSRYKPKPNQAPPQTDNKAEDARLKAYEQKRARFLAKKRAQMQSSTAPRNIPSNTLPHSPLQPQRVIHQPQQIYNPPSSNPHQIHETQPPVNHHQNVQHITPLNESHNIQQDGQQIYNTQLQDMTSKISPHTSIPPLNEVSEPHNVQNMYQTAAVSRSEKHHKEHVQQPSDYNAHNQSQQKKSKQEIYRNELLQQMNEKETANKQNTKHNEYFTPYTHSEMDTNIKEEKRAKQEKYRNELMQQMKEQKIHNPSAHSQNNQHNERFGSSISPYKRSEHDVNEMKRIKQEKYRNQLLQQMKEQKIHNKPSYADPKNKGYFSPYKYTQSKEDKRAKQEKYRNELMQQMKEQKIQYPSSHAHNHQHNDHFVSSTSPYKHHQTKEEKRAKQEKYRLELMEQMRLKQNHIGKSVHKYNKTDEIKETEEVEEHKKYDYAKELEEQMKLKQLTKMAEKEKQLLEDRKRMLMGGGFMGGFGSPSLQNNATEQTRNNNKNMLYKMELDKQCKELHAKKMREKLLHEREELRLEAKVKRDREQIIKEKYKDDLDSQSKMLHEKRKLEQYKHYEEEMQLEMKIKNEREQMKKQYEQSRGIFGRDAEREKLEKARKQELYQQELKQQAMEIKRKKKEKELMELEKEKKLEMKIQRELRELEMRYKREKEVESNPGVAPNIPKTEPNIELFAPNKRNIATNQNIANVHNASNTHISPNVPVANMPMIEPNVDLFAPNTRNIHNTPPVSQVSKVPVITNAPHLIRDNVNSTAHTFHENGASSERIPVIAYQHHNVYNNRPSTSKRVFTELLNLKQDLLQNQKMIRTELEMHKQQINQQLATVSSQNEREKLQQSNSNTFQNELSQYHNKISNEISNLRHAIIEQQTQKRKKHRSITSAHTPKQHRFDIDKNSKFIPCTVPPTPLLPQTVSTPFTNASTYDCNNDNQSRLNTGFTVFGVDEYLLKECKQNNEYLHSLSSTRMHTPNIYRVDSLEKEINLNRFGGRNGGNICEKSIKSKSDFLYNAMLKKEEEEEEEEKNEEMQTNDHHQLPDIAEIIDDERNDNDIVNKLLLKNKNRLNYFRSTTPLDSTRSLKIGLQKIEDLLSETEKLNTNHTQSERNLESIDFDDSLYELI